MLDIIVMYSHNANKLYTREINSKLRENNSRDKQLMQQKARHTRNWGRKVKLHGVHPRRESNP